MPVDLSTIPLVEIQEILSILTGKTQFTWDMIPKALKVLAWGFESLKGDKPLAIGSELISDQEAIESLVNGSAIEDDLDGVAGGGILVSMAVSIVLKVVTKMLADYFNK